MNDSQTTNQFSNEPQWQEQVISIDRVARVVKGGRRFRFRTLVAVGDGKRQVGVGVAKGSDVQSSVTKAVAEAKRNLIKISTARKTIPHEITVRHGGAIVMLKPAAPGTGVKAGGAVRMILDVTGIEDVLSKSLGSSNKINNAYATIEALDQLVPSSEWLNQSKNKSNKTTQTKKSKTATGSKK